MRGSDIVTTCTDSNKLVVTDSTWIEKGMHLANCSSKEFSFDIVKRCDINPGRLYYTLSRLSRLMSIDSDRRTSARGEGKDCLPASWPIAVPGAPEGVIAR